MNRMRRIFTLLLAALLLLPASRSLAEEERMDAPVAEKVAEGSLLLEQEAENSPVHVSAYAGDALYRQIQDTYKAAKKRARRRSFKGYCGAYVANQLVVLGINRSYLSANGKNTYDIYRSMDVTTGGYRVTAYGAKRYSLTEALSKIMEGDPSACNILVGFQRSTSRAGKKYGHVLFIHGIKNGKIYFSDSCSRTIDDVKYREGEPIVCSLASFVAQYAKCKLDGVVHFQKEKGQRTAETQPAVMSETALGNSEKVVAVG